MTDIIGQVREGMHVLDSAGQNIGSVVLVKVGDPDAVPTGGRNPDARTEIFALGRGGAVEPDVPPSPAEHLLRSGFVKISAKGLFERDLYLAAEQVTAVDYDTVTVNAVKDDLIGRRDEHPPHQGLPSAGDRTTI